MTTLNGNHPLGLDQLTKRAVRAFWVDGLWDLAFAGVLLLMGLWGSVYVRFLAFPSPTWPFGGDWDRQAVAWLGLLALIASIGIYIWLAWVIVKALKRRLVAPFTGHVKHSLFLPMDRKVFIWYAVLYLGGMGLLYLLFAWLKGGFYIMSIPFILSPAAIYWGIGRVYEIRRYQRMALCGFILALSLELILTTPAVYQAGPRNFLDVIPAWGNPLLPCLIWGGTVMVSGLYGLISVRRPADAV